MLLHTVLAKRVRTISLFTTLCLPLASCTPNIGSETIVDDCLPDVRPASITNNSFLIAGTIAQSHVTRRLQFAHSDVLVLHNSNGGSVSAGIRLSELASKVHITGTRCASMCVYVAMMHPNVYLSPELKVFTFHSVVNVNLRTCETSHNKAETRSFVEQYPVELQQLLSPLLAGDETFDVSVERVESIMGRTFQRLAAVP
jgi:hypothetical protein